jgi:hypothetical protein
MGVVGRLDQYALMLATEFDETTANNPSITGLGTYYASEFSENVGITTTLDANVFAPYDPVYDEFGGTLFGAGQGRYMRQYTDKSVIVYNEIDEVTDFRDIVRTGLVLDLDAAQPLSYKGTGTTWTDLSGNNKNATLVGDQISYLNDNGGVFSCNGIGGSDPDYFSLPNTSLILGANFTIEVWNYYNLVSQPSADPWSSGLYTNSAESDWSAGAGNNNGLIFGYNSIVYRNTFGSEIQVDYSSAPTTQVWHQHVLVVNSGTGTVYVDKVQVATLSNTRTYTQSNGTLGIAVSDKLGSAYRGEYRGYISSVKVYNKSLTAAEVSQNYNALKHRFGL